MLTLFQKNIYGIIISIYIKYYNIKVEFLCNIRFGFTFLLKIEEN